MAGNVAKVRRLTLPPASLCLILALGGGSCAPRTPASQSPQEPARPGQPTPGAGAAAKPTTPPARMATSPDGTRIAYETAGTGPALLLLHGGGQTRRSWNEGGYVEHLSKQFTVITVDLRGSGDSGKPPTPEAYALDRVLADLLAVADAAAAPRFHVWGFGHGATIGRYLAARSDRVISAVLVSARMGEAVSGMLKDAITGMRAHWLPLLTAKAAGTLDPATLSPGDRLALEGGVASSVLPLGALVDYPPLEPDEIKAPTLWIVGADDSSLMENVKMYEGKLSGTRVTLKVLGSTSYTDSFLKSDRVLPEAEPFLTGAVQLSDQKRPPV